MELTPSRVVSAALAQVGKVLQLVAEEFAGDVDVLATNYDDLLTIEKLLGDGRR